MTAKQHHSTHQPARRVGVLIANLGTPDGTGYWPMRRYLSEFLSDPQVIDYPWWLWQPLLQLVILTKRPFTSGRAYRSIWNTDLDESPLLTITRAQSVALAQEMHTQHGDRVLVDFCMRYGNPSTKSVVAAMVERGCDRIVFFPLYPQFSRSSAGTAADEFRRCVNNLANPPEVRIVDSYFDHPKFIAALAASVKAETWAETGPPDTYLASYHGMPKRYISAGDPYQAQCEATSAALQSAMGWRDGQLVTAYQSRFGPEDWLKPYTAQKAAELARNGAKHLAALAPAFAADCIETLEEINGEIRESFLSAGGEVFTYIPCLNDTPQHIEMLKAMVDERLDGWLT